MPPTRCRTAFTLSHSLRVLRDQLSPPNLPPVFVERFQREHVAMLAAGRTWAAVSLLAESVPALHTHVAALRDRRRRSRDLRHVPVREVSTRRIGIVDHQRK